MAKREYPSYSSTEMSVEQMKKAFKVSFLFNLRCRTEEKHLSAVVSLAADLFADGLRHFRLLALL